jgi:hypothetical protein
VDFCGYFSIPNVSEASHDQEDHSCKEALVQIEGMTCQSCVKHIEATISLNTGVQRVNVSLKDKQGKQILIFLFHTHEKAK